MSIPWQAYYDASAYTERYGVCPSLLTAFKAHNMDDPSQLPLANQSYTIGNGSLRSKRKWHSPPLSAWFPTPTDDISILARTASTSSLDWTRPPSIPLTLSAYLPGSGRHLVDISPDASVAELKLQLLLAARLPAPLNLDALHLFVNDHHMTEGRVGSFFSTSMPDPNHIDIDATYAAPLPSQVPPFTFPLPRDMLLPSPTPSSSRQLPSLSFWPSPNSAEFENDPPASSADSSRQSSLKCCAHESSGLVGLGIMMSPASSCDSSDDGTSWPTTPLVDDFQEWKLPTPKHLHALFVPPQLVQ